MLVQNFGGTKKSIVVSLKVARIDFYYCVRILLRLIVISLQSQLNLVNQLNFTRMFLRDLYCDTISNIIIAQF